MVGFIKFNVVYFRLFGWGMLWVIIVDFKVIIGFLWCNVFCILFDILMIFVN